ncbi:GNAT family N-acetyltransferase [Acinetobacter colistiniresistens]|uniref:GNAT family N-acetyltransferase n=1 Tax=Acinetobacter colistiniresistens TaxID=280145 RepID=UPI00125047CE|nr:GNAT family N-acetyltransferase [Acinetobacter colistiniresistens]
MLIVKTATVQDVQTLIHFGKRLTVESPNFCNQGFNETLAVQFFTHLIEHSKSVFIIFDENNPIGTLVGEIGLCWRTGQTLAFEHGLYVLPKYRKTGAASMLIEHYMVWISQKNVDRLQLGTMTGIHADKTIQLYEKHGLKLTGYVLEKEI